MVQLTPDLIQKAYAAGGYSLFTNGDYNLNIGGIRYYNNLDQFTDLKFVLYKINGAWTVAQWNQTTKPGLSSLLHPMNAEGCGTLVEKQYLHGWRVGYHQGIEDTAHEALIQCVSGLSVYRDKEKDGIIRYDNEHMINDATGVDHHGTWIAVLDKIATAAKGHNVVAEYSIDANYLYPTVGGWSQGCNVMGKPKDQQEFIALCKLSKEDTFSYTLFKDSQFFTNG